jgi:hypothetical protein
MFGFLFVCLNTHQGCRDFCRLKFSFTRPLNHILALMVCPTNKFMLEKQTVHNQQVHVGSKRQTNNVKYKMCSSRHWRFASVSPFNHFRNGKKERKSLQQFCNRRRLGSTQTTRISPQKPLALSKKGGTNE